MPQSRWDLEVLAHREPDRLGVDPRLQRRLRTQAAEAADDLVARDSIGVGGPELLTHALPELGDPHVLNPNPPPESGAVRRRPTKCHSTKQE